MEEGPAAVKQPAPKRQDKPVTDRKNAVRRISVNPISGVALVAQQLVAAVKPQTSLRYNLMWAYGGFLVLVPRRLGVNEALDTAVDALVTTHKSFASCKRVTLGSLTKYSRALNALTRCLDDPVTASSSETLCAVSVLLLVQVILSAILSAY